MPAETHRDRCVSGATLAPRKAPGALVPVTVTTLILISGALGLMMALVVPPGLPYDEPAHWANVQFYLTQGRLPVLGEPGVGYQGQQTPAYYAMAAIVAAVAGDGGFLAVRLLGVLGQMIVVCLSAFILRAVAPTLPLVFIGGAAFLALNPMLLVMAGSVQNDTWALVWALLALWLALSRRRGPTWLRGIAIGLALSLAVLTKLSMAPVVLAVLVALLVRRRFVEAATALAVSCVGTGWWIVRNVVLYGDLTGQSAVILTGAEFENVRIGPLGLAQRMLTYLTIPSEYLRNTIEAPLLIDAACIAVGVVLIIGIVMIALRRKLLIPWPLLLVLLVAVFAVGAWVAQVTFGWPVSFRTAYAALPAFALAAGMAPRTFTRTAGQVSVLAVTAALQLVVLTWTVMALAGVDQNSMLWAS
jgi:4-amino-4-deoxy-L-arabinose transferase-like glycosyltransferase